MIRRFIGLWLTSGLLFGSVALAWVASAQGTPPASIFAEAINQANLRAVGDISGELVGQIVVGTRYPVIGRNQFQVSTWYLLGDPASAQPIGWVYFELVTLTGGDIGGVPFSSLNVSAPPTPTPSPSASPTAGDANPSADATVAPASPAGPTATPPPTYSVYGVVGGEINIRYGPGPDFARLAVAQAGDRLPIVGYHTQFPWLQVALDGAPNGVGWVASELLEVEGDVFSTRPITQTDFSTQPTLTPTPAVLQGGSVARGTPVPVSAGFAALGQTLWNTVLEAGFDPATNRFGALYLRDLRTGEELTFGNSYAFSGTSINKVAILAKLFDVVNGDPPAQLANDIANTMICSENVATNRLLAAIGGGSTWTGAENVTQFLTQLGLRRTFLTAPYEVPGQIPEPAPAPVRYPVTDVDQVKANPNSTNQMTVDELGYLMGTLYECAVNESGPLLTQFSNYTPQECRKMLHVMANNNVDALLKAGAPAEIAVAHKHGWVPDTHGNAAVFFTPGGDYVIVMMLHQPQWLDYSESLPVIAEVSRLVYNHYNPSAPLDAVREGFIPEAADCNFAGTPLVNDVLSPFYGAALPFDPLPIIGQ